VALATLELYAHCSTRLVHDIYLQYHAVVLVLRRSNVSTKMVHAGLMLVQRLILLLYKH
jgi:hypothetical protein